jgi:alpha-L-fucosidase 2
MKRFDRYFFIVLRAVAAVLMLLFCIMDSLTTAHSQPSQPTLQLWYSQPAEKWTEALPIGNGRMGAMVFGGISEERIQFNEDTLWKGKPHDYVREGAGQHLAEIRRLLSTNNVEDGEQAQKIVRENFLSDPVRQLPYQPFGDLRFTFPGHDQVTDYRRELDLDSGIARVSYRVNGVAYRREAFASYTDQVIVLRLTADKPGSVNFTLNMDSPHQGSQTKAIGSDTFALSGQVQEDGLRFESRVRVVGQGGRVSAGEDGIKVENASAATVLLIPATSFKNFQDISADPGQRAAAMMAKVSKRTFNAILAAHLTDHRRFFRRMSLNLGRTPQASLPTNERLKALKGSRLVDDPALAALYFQYGRYLLMASSRPGSQPANLQGIWNEEMNPPWESKWTTNINVEMNYWPAELTNLSEMHEPLFDLIADLVISGARTARKQYGARGWVLHHNTDLWRGTAPINNIDGVWPTGAAWLCHHMWEHYLFTGDRPFLAQRAYPAMKEASLFFVDSLIKDPETGYLVTNPSHSPEQSPPDRPTLTYGPTMDSQLIRALLTNTIESSRILGKDKDLAAQLAQIRSQLPPNMVGKHGQLQEWLKDWDQPNNAHRHMSPLWALYPGTDITPADPKIFDAAKVLLTWRGDGSTGWSYAWRIPLWARVGDGEFAFRQLASMLERRTLPNLLDLCGPFQIDGNFGGTAGIAELLLQSHEVEAPNSRTPIVNLLPALPKAWPSGSITGLRARGGFEVDMTWDKGALTRTVIRSKLGNPCRVRYGNRVIALKTQRGKQYAFDGQLRTAR